MSSFCIGLCAMRLDWPLTVLLALPHGLLVGMEVQLIKRDWAYRRNLQALEEGSYASLGWRLSHGFTWFHMVSHDLQA